MAFAPSHEERLHAPGGKRGGGQRHVRRLLDEGSCLTMENHGLARGAPRCAKGREHATALMTLADPMPIGTPRNRPPGDRGCW